MTDVKLKPCPFDLWHGDCLELMKQIPDGSVDMVLTDIPYGAVNRSSNGLRNLDKGVADIETFALHQFLPEVDRVTRGSVLVFCGKEQFSQIWQHFATKKGCVRAIVWEKTNPSPMNGQHMYLSGVEFAVWFKKKGSTFNAFCKNTVFRFPNGHNKIHPTEKNLKLITELLLDNTEEGATVLDPCMGSGTTGIACVNTGRKFIGMELNDGYFETASRRIEEAWNRRVNDG